MKRTIRIGSTLNTRNRRSDRKLHTHKLPVCESTSLARYRDRHQARQGAKALNVGTRGYEVHTFACPSCQGFHLEQTLSRQPLVVEAPSQASGVFKASLGSRKRRYILFDVENPTCGAKVTCEQVATLWNLIKQQAPGIAPHDHVVVGAARRVVRKYRAAIHGDNVKWVVGADAPDGADRALLSAIDVRRVARDFDELVIISGDHAFVPVASQAKALGLVVHVVTVEHPTSSTMLARDLAAIANTRSFIRLKPRQQKQDSNTATEAVAPRALLSIDAAAA